MLTKSSTLVLATLFFVSSIVLVDSFCGGCHCNIFSCNCDCALGTYCNYPLKNVHAATSSYYCNAQNSKTDNIYRRSISVKSNARQLFSTIDTNKDGVLSTVEIISHTKHTPLSEISAIDLNKDGVITANEFDSDLAL